MCQFIIKTSGVMVSMFCLSAVDHGFYPQLGQTKDYKFWYLLFSFKNTALRSYDQLYIEQRLVGYYRSWDTVFECFNWRLLLQ